MGCFLSELNAVTTGSYIRNLRVSTMGKYSGPYTVGKRFSKSWSGANYPAGKPDRTNVPPPTIVAYRNKVVSYFEEVRQERFRYVKRFYAENPATAARSNYNPRRLPGVGAAAVRKHGGSDVSRKPRIPVPIVRYEWVRERYWVTKKVKRFRNEIVAYNVRPPTVYYRSPKRGRLVEHAYNCNWTDEETTIKNYTIPGVGNYSNSSALNAVTFSNPWTSNDDLNLIGKLREKVAGSDFNAGVTLGEGKKTLEMIADSATRLAKAIRATKRGDLASAAHHLTGSRGFTKKTGSRKPSKYRKSDVIQNNWLELQYGWLPLLSDVHAGAKFLAHQMSVPNQQTVRVSRNKEHVAIIPASAGWYNSKYTSYTRKSIKATIAEKDIAQLSGLTDPLSVAWELVPFSFVVDWFIPIGNYLSARGLSQALSGTFVTSTVFRDNRYGEVQKGQNITNLSFQGNYSYVSGTMSRVVSSSLAIPLPSFKPLSEVPSWTRCANALALLTTIRF